MSGNTGYPDLPYEILIAHSKRMSSPNKSGEPVEPFYMLPQDVSRYPLQSSNVWSSIIEVDITRIIRNNRVSLTDHDFDKISHECSNIMVWNRNQQLALGEPAPEPVEAVENPSLNPVGFLWRWMTSQVLPRDQTAEDTKHQYRAEFCLEKNLKHSSRKQMQSPPPKPWQRAVTTISKAAGYNTSASAFVSEKVIDWVEPVNQLIPSAIDTDFDESRDCTTHKCMVDR